MTNGAAMHDVDKWRTRGLRTGRGADAEADHHEVGALGRWKAERMMRRSPG